MIAVVVVVVSCAVRRCILLSKLLACSTGVGCRRRFV